jgi:transaldolase
VTLLHDLHRLQGQSPWLDNLRRDELKNGHIDDLVARGVRGITSNPTIFQKAISSSSAYDDQIADCTSRGSSVVDTYWDLVVTDVIDACEILSHLHAGSDGEDGFVSLEVDPHMAKDPERTVRMARELSARVGRPNLMIKVPATRECLPAISEILADGVSVNVTLIFGLQRYREVLEAFVEGIRRCADRHPDRLSRVRSVASFFVSRVDSTVDSRLESLGRSDLCGRAAVHQARAAYQLQSTFFEQSAWRDLHDRGAHRQRPLWASTSTKNPAYPDLLYVDQLIGPGSVNTLPEPTLVAFEDHGVVERTIDRDPDASARFLGDLKAISIDLEEVADTLERDGIASFAESFDQLIDVLRSKVR